MTHYVFTFKDAYARALGSMTYDSESLDDAVSVALDLLIAKGGAWAVELRNRAGFVLRIDLMPMSAGMMSAKGVASSRPCSTHPQRVSQLSLLL